MVFSSIPVNNCNRPVSRTVGLSDAIDEILGMAFHPTVYHYPRYLCLPPSQNSPAKSIFGRNQNGDQVKVAALDVRKYKPKEIECKVENGKILVTGKQRVETENGYETSEFHRAFNLPENVDQESVKSRIENGVLHIEAVKQQHEVEEKVDEAAEDNKKVSLKINLGSYKPEEVNVKLQGNRLVVSAEHKTEHEEFFTCRYFKQYFTLPNEVDASTVASKLSQDGVLTIEVERKTTPAIEDKDIEVQRDEETEENTEE